MKKKYTEEDYIKKCEEFGMEYIGYHKDKHGKSTCTFIDFICPHHRDKGIQSITWGHFRTYRLGCPYCAGRYKTTKDIIPLIKNKNVEVISEYKGNEKPIKCRCKICGHEWTTVTKVLTTNGSGCPKCGRLNADNSRRKTQEQFIKDLAEVNPDIEVVGQYKNTHTKIRCRCKKDGFEWDAYPANLLNRSAGCYRCNASLSEKLLLNILDEMQIKYKHQYIIKDCKYVDVLKFDAFDVDNNIAFEYNGEQHYYPVDFAGKGEEWARDQFQLTQQRDNAKIKYCNDNNIPIVIIPYWEKNNMESFIRNKLDLLEQEEKIN